MTVAVDASGTNAAEAGVLRDANLRGWYLQPALAAIPRVLASVDLNPFGPSYGCCDRQFWHYRTAAFPSEMYQEAALPLALAYAREFPGNVWFGEPRVAEAATAVMRFSARSAHADGSGDDYYPNERALGAAVFSLQAQTEAYRLLALDDAGLRQFFLRRARWIAAHDESGRLSNHHALAALALWRTAEITDRNELREAATARVRQVLAWQSAEGWFEEYGGADPGYQTITIDALAKLRREARFEWLTEPLRRAVSFARWFQHLDGSYGGEYGSRGTRHFFPHGFELSAAEDADAAALADDYLRSLVLSTAARFDDDRMYVHRISGLIEAYCDWSPRRPAPTYVTPPRFASAIFREAGLSVTRDEQTQLIISTARGGVFHVYRRRDDHGDSLVDAGLVVEFDDGRTAVSQTHDITRETAANMVAGPLHYVRYERATPLKQAALHLVTTMTGRWGRNIVRKLLQRRVITGRREAPMKLTRTFHIKYDDDGRIEKIRITDDIELTSQSVCVRRLSLASDLQAAYTAAAYDYHPTLKQPWRDLAEFVDELNKNRRVTIFREF